MRPTVLSINDVVEQMEPMLRGLIGVDVVIDLALDQSLGMIKADEGQIEQVLLNVALNARDAMPHGRVLTVETANVTLQEGFVQQGHFHASAGPHVMLCVTDTGVGMDGTARARLFEPFHTTKSPGKGTGLGLSTVYGIVKQSGGSIWVYSEPGIGTTFKIYFPLHEGTVAEGEAPVVAGTPARGSGYVLVVDDDANIRMDNFLEKPFTPDSLAQAVYQLVALARSVAPPPATLTA